MNEVISSIKLDGKFFDDIAIGNNLQSGAGGSLTKCQMLPTEIPEKARLIEIGIGSGV
jgi:hypothetical protein